LPEQPQVAPSAGVLTFTVLAHATPDGLGQAHVHGGGEVGFDASAGRSAELPSPADLLTAAFAACTLKNVARFSAILGFSYQQARIEVVSRRQDSPPRISRVEWVLTVVTSDPPDRLRLLQTNIERQGTVYNTVAAAAEIVGRIVIEPAPDPG
jgi:uncharacterized OsmC-like protein